ncbi:hypothetical protein JXL21_12535 [Candidatus Bathyarchaeota archaeon]|nr:hypothetical protein [Candidatus Bathyarchaeota archaeon]
MNKNRKALALTSVLLLTLTIAVGGLYLASADAGEDDATSSDPPQGWLRPRMGGRMMGSLDEELRTELMDTVQAMSDEGATREEIAEYVKSFLEENGVEPCPQLSEEQLEAMQQLREDVEAYAEQRAEELGIELPPMGFFGGGRMGSSHGPRMGFGFRGQRGACSPEAQEG